MKANEFVKKVGWDLAKEYADECPSYCNYLHEHGFYSISETWQLNEKHVLVLDLKRIIKSYDLVDKWQGLEASKIKVNLLLTFGFHTQAGQLQQAIADVESCQ